MTRQAWISNVSTLSIVRQCALAGVSRATIYAQQIAKPVDEHDLLYSRLIDEEYTLHPFYGTRRMVVFLAKAGHTVNRKRVQRLMRLMGLVGMAPGPNTSRSHPAHKVYPYLLRDVPVTRPNHVWSTDITYIRLNHGFVYLVAIMDWYSRRVLSWRISNSMDTVFCVDCLDDALRIYGKPEIFNSDQGSQFTSIAFTDVLKREDITISMDGRGRAFDNIFVERLWRNVKHEDVYLHGYATMEELLIGLTKYFSFYNGERPHQALGYETPNEVYRTKRGGGALIVDKFPRAVAEDSVSLRSTPSSATARGNSEEKAEATSTTTSNAKSHATPTPTATSKSKAKSTTKSSATATSDAKTGQRRSVAMKIKCTA
jgi:putative transposase